MVARGLFARSYRVPLRQQLRTVSRISAWRSLWASLRCRGLVVVGRGCRIQLSRGARVDVPRGSLLIVGVEGDSRAGAVIELRPRARLHVRGRVQMLRGAVLHVNWAGTLRIGHGAFLNEGARIVCHEEVEIGEHSAISWDVLVTDSDVHQLVADGRDLPKTLPVTIGPRCWLGARSIVLKGADVGPGAVVAAGAVVTRRVGSGTLVAGNPARTLRSDVEWRL